MAHEDEGHYAAKHPEGTPVDERIAAALEGALDDRGRLRCATANRIARDLDVEMKQVGTTADLKEYRITKCLLGLFGQGEKYGEGKIEAASEWSEGMEQAIRDALVDERLSCAAAWRIAKERDVARTRVAAVCQALKIKISPCQLGAFKKGKKARGAE